ncbi:hypothetical protein TELCIR_01387 [Teladorsagia circumcincta]|uniref:Uncharacterized protein n=1 Tax=Teladorsagia circumcincta TaxID=45464 RepID=A0A2G9V246_TELCI|nr:hypothetical protein TELCIR_01387 [Teladorsagia circumcincta]
MVSTAETSKPTALLSSVSVKRQAMRPPKRFIPDMEHSRELVGASVPPMPPPSPLSKPEQFDPLTDLLGKELVDFLDPNYVTKDDEEEPGYADEVRCTQDIDFLGVKIYIPQYSPGCFFEDVQLMLFLLHFLIAFRPLSLAPPQPCHTFGGCLFDRTMCSFTHPPEVPIPNYFMRVRVGYSHFARARVAPGTTSVLETATNMLEPHTVFFDALEWQSGTRLIGCCSDRTGARQCPFATPVEAGVLLWQSASFDCPAYTVKVSDTTSSFGSNSKRVVFWLKLAVGGCVEGMA